MAIVPMVSFLSESLIFSPHCIATPMSRQWNVYIEYRNAYTRESDEGKKKVVWPQAHDIPISVHSVCGLTVCYCGNIKASPSLLDDSCKKMPKNIVVTRKHSINICPLLAFL